MVILQGSFQAHVTRALLRPGYVIVSKVKLHRGFHASQQDDAHEFHLFTLDALQRACPPGRPSQEDATLIHRVFGGHWRSQIQCLCCHGVSDTLYLYLDIGLDIQGAQSVTQALDLLRRPQRLARTDGYQCVLTLVLKRFSALADSKVETEVRYPERLDQRPYLSLWWLGAGCCCKASTPCWYTRAAPATGVTTSAKSERRADHGT
ncbi:PREDICTED: ubiquitin carboxyl-terminal hydrolase 17-like protein 6 [Myotis davidii]|uniref:ubiquitin carboxyl-terminal hydrolase 17-like protein 6 n=1 Tax=Myotis davidii TaxID=225400 RepID=UPI0003EBB7B2|nr:PREDICTED: ubiquitin carboxyl-terminal hydrolase 17-like protein 6 [Myotis davidii]